MTRIHRRIGRRLKKFTTHYTKYLAERDTIFATIAVFVFLILLGMIPINFYVLNPMKLALKDFDFNDIAYAKLKQGTTDTFDRHIRIVNIGDADRGKLAYIIEKVSSFKPKVIGLDAYFEAEKDPFKDSILRDVFEKTPNLIVGARLGINEKNEFVKKPDFFEKSLSQTGFVNLNAMDIGTVRNFAPFEEIDHKIYPHFTSAIAKIYDSNAYNKLKKRHKEVEIINYSRHQSQYFTIDKEDLMEDAIADTILRDKIVLLGYVNEDPDDIEDKKFTPLNVNYAGKQYPDMNGVMVQANIISMILEGNYAHKMPKWGAWLVAVLIGWLHMSLFIRYYLEDHIWFHLVAKLVQVFSVIIFAYLGIYLYQEYRIKLEMKYTIYVIALSVDIIYFYEAFAVWMHKKFGFKTVFHQHHHG